jgi:hypothetical protein
VGAQPSEMSDIVIVMDDGGDAAKLDQLANTLKATGVTVEDVDHDNCVIEANAATGDVARIEKLPGVKYVRKVFTYESETPPGDKGSGNEEDETIPR